MKKLGFIGGGNMAEALMRGLLEKKLFKPADLIASDVDAARRNMIRRKLKVETTDDNRAVLQSARAILLAVKPQNIDEVLVQLAAAMRPAVAAGADAGNRAGRKSAPPPREVTAKNRLFISIAAGITLARLGAGLGARVRVIRVMPNAPAMVGLGMAALVRAPGTGKADEAFALRIFRAVGDAVALTREELLDAVTALSGSGPAYVYLFIKAMADAGVAEGLPSALAMRMALQTVRGAEESMRRSPLGAEELIRIVASPGGTTEAALRAFAGARFSDIVAEALHAAAIRSRELGRS